MGCRVPGAAAGRPPSPSHGPRTRRYCALTCGSVGASARLTVALRASPNAVREGNVVLVDDLRLGALRGGAPAAPAAPAVRHAGDSVLLLGARGEPGSTPAPPRRLSKFHAPEIVFGPNSVQEPAHAAVRLGARRPFVVTDPGLTEAGWPAELLRHLRATGLAPQLW